MGADPSIFLGSLRGHTISIESPARTLPAGWYTDPAKSGGKRWWDGTKWTEHLKMPEKPAPSAAAAVPATPYGIGTPNQAAFAPFADELPTGVPDPIRASNESAFISLLFGLVAVGFTLTTLVPGPLIIWSVSAGLVAILAGIRAISLRVNGLSTNAWAPVIGILLGLSATAVTVFGIPVLDMVNSTLGVAAPASPSSAPAVATPTRPQSPEPFVFANNSALTKDGSVVQTIATTLNNAYAGGNSSLASGQAWPASLTFSDTAVLSPSGALLTTVDAGHVFAYTLASDTKSYVLRVSAKGSAEAAIYNSATNKFTFSCLASDATCVPVP
jgi:hypothetical protein